MSSEVKLGQPITDAAATRDAIHVAVIPLTAVRRMMPGEKLKSGIVDPFLRAPVEVGKRYWLLLYPGTITGLRHVWSAPAFPEEQSA